MNVYHSSFTRILAVVVVFLTFVACGIGAPAAPTPTTPPTPLAAPTETAVPPTPSPESGAISSLTDVRRATIQIEAQGSFMDPEVGLQLNVAGRGSGFIIDESGIAVTNNHVVTGAALLKVWVGGESEPRNARILGVSECSDLAVIDIEGDGYPYLEWYDGPITTGLDVYAAGFPLGDPEFTLTRGIVSKERASGETSWASIDAVIEHDATINPGNSGGPLVTEDGKVVAVNYASVPDFNQYFAIARDEAIKVIEQLRAGQDVDSIGVNGTAVNDGEGLSGIWVASVKSGSPADNTGIKSGDIIVSLEGLVLATDGTMADYCDILRSHDPGDILRVEVIRFATAEVLEGQLNGRELEQSFSFAQELQGEVDENAETVTYNYTTVTDDSGVVTMEVPQEWNDVTGFPWEENGEIIGASIVASSNIDDFYNSYSTPGVFFGASRVLAQTYDAAGLLDLFDFTDGCTYDGRYDYEDPLYTGLYDFYTDCGGVGTIVVNLAAMPEDQSLIILLQLQVVSEADLDAADRILNTFQVIGDLPSEGTVSTAPPAEEPTTPSQPATATFFEDFEGPLAGDWNLKSGEEATREIIDGELHLTVHAANTLVWSSPGRYEAGDIVVELDARQVAGPDNNNYGVIIRYQDPNNFYEFDISGDGYAAIAKWEDGDFTILADWQASSSINPGNASNHLTVVAQGSRMDFYVNGDRVASVTDSAFDSGDIALVAGTYDEAGVHIAFDNVSVKRPGAGAESPEPPPPTPAPTSTPTPSPSSEIPAEWFPPPGKASIVLVNEASADLVFTMGNQEHKLIANTQKVVFYDPGSYTYTASDPRFESYNSECVLKADTIYYWYTDDSSWGSCFQIWP